MITSALKKWTIVPIMGLVWIFALLYGSGIGQAYDIYGRAKVVVVLVLILHLIVSGKLRRIPLQNFLLFAYLLVVTLITSFIYGKNMLDYLWLYGIVYLISLLPVAKEPMRIVSLMYGVVGMASQQKMADGIAELLGRDNLKRGVKIYTNEDHSLRIDLFIIVQYGISIVASSNSIIETVKYSLEKATGLVVKEERVLQLL